MHQNIYSDLKNRIMRNKRHTVLKRIVSTLSITVMFCTTYALILPAITMEQKTFCGVEEHTHSEACYSQIQQTELVCSAQNLNIHTHAEGCYGPEGNLICGQCDYVAHTHDSGCHNDAGELVCTLAERAVHVHAESCYVPGETQPEVLHVHSDACNVLQRGELICTQEELEGHTHGDACYEPSDILLCTKQENHVHAESCYEIPLVCTQSTEPHAHGTDCYGRGSQTCVTVENHVHGADCYGKGSQICSTQESHVHGDSCWEKISICQNEAEDHICDDTCYESRMACTIPENHSHGDACFETIIVCKIPENHSHDDSCYESIVVCGREEGEQHVHDSGCYGPEKLICTEDENHVHIDSCYEPRLICTSDEFPGHAHGDECYEQITIIGCGLNEGDPEPTEPVEPVLICTEAAAQVHVHGDSCFETVVTQASPICGNEAADHEHTAECYVIQCGLEEHTHDTACYSDPEADLETAAIWEATFAHVELTGNWQEDVLSIAKTQLGYTESANNYSVWADGTTHGYTRYGQWYGSSYGDWCAMFVSFCLNYAEVEGMPLHWGVRPWIEELTKLKLYHEAEVYTPKPGDLIFYDWEGDDLSDHVGFVAEIIPETEYEPAQVKALEGNSSNCVQYVYYEYDDSRILGYSELPDNIEIYSCGILRHIHNEYCHDAAGDLTCLQVEHLHTELCEPRDTLYCGMEIHNHSEGCFDEAGELICQITEHTHNEVCYVQAPAEEEKTFYCSQEEHTHTETCYDEAGELVCEIPEHTHTEECTAEPVVYYCGQEEHTHAETCYDEAGALVCEISEHTHTEECIAEPIVPTYYCELEEHIHAETCYDEAGELVCEIPEHTHTEECTAEPVVYYCGQEEHAHAETCYDEAGALVCEISEHTHTEECIAEPTVPTYYCELEEHIHAETCYDEAGELICEISEHTHTEECTVEPVVYYCGLEEHTHVETCYDEAGELVCEIPEHTHTEECTAEPVVYYCGQEEHTHAETCYDEAGELICEIPEHTHTEECTAEPVVYYCFKQEHTHTDVCYDESGNLLCQVPEHTHTEECTKIPVYLCGMEEHTHAEECYDEAGNLICQTHEHIHSEQCVIVGGYICGLEEHTHNENCYDAEGNFICTLEEHTHTDACKAQNAYACGLDEHTHGEGCYDEEGNLICEIPEHIHTAACVGRNLYYSDMQIRVHAVISGVENLPAKLTLKVRKVVPEQDPQSFGDMQVAVSEEMADTFHYLSQASFYEMYLLSEDQIYDLPETASVTVTMDFEEPVFTPDAVAEATGTHAYMLTPEGGMQLPPDLTAGEQQTMPEEEITEPEKSPSLMESVISDITSGLQTMLTPAMALDDLTLTEDPTAANTEGENSDDSEIPDNSNIPADILTPGTVYTVSGLTGENYANPTRGITSITFQTNRLATFAVVLEDELITGKFWTRIYDPANIVSGGSYLIISAEGNMALNGTGGNTEVHLKTVKNNEEYYIIELDDGSQVGSGNNNSVVGSNLYWTITRNNNTYRIRSQSSNSYLYLNNRLLNTKSANLTLTKEDAEKCIRINNGNNYLRNTEGTGFSYGTGNDGTSYNNNLYNSRDMMIFALSDKTSLTVPGDVLHDETENNKPGSSSTKPNYGDFVNPSNALTGDTAVNGENHASVPGKYYSDPSTSQLEANFREDTFAENLANDGKVMTDKSVIYGMDNYGAFDSYGSNMFSVTLSALGQEYKVPYQSQVRTPVDVVYILDVSGSMSTESTSTDGGRDPDRATAVVKAVNDSIKRIMDDHEKNRVGIVLYSTGAWNMLPLDRYVADNDQYLYNATRTLTHKPTNYTPSVNMILGSSSLKSETTGKSFAEAGADAMQGIGTYTQAGIAKGYEVFQAIGNDTKYTVQTENGPEEVIRQPVFILLSDGEPTHSTNNYMDVLHGPHYGNGQGAVSNAKGIMGYNTILSANYYKRMVAIQYQKPVKFFTVGMSIDESADGPLVSGSDTGDNYKRFVLNPQQSELDNLSGTNNNETNVLLRNLLNSDYDDHSVGVNNLWPDNWTGDPHKHIPVVTPNPYAGNYDYADNAFFGELDNKKLSEIFANILTYSTEESPYSFILYKDTYVTMRDIIGQGMEIKGTPVLRYEGTNYYNPTVSTAYICGGASCTVTDDDHIHDKTVVTYVYNGTYDHPYLGDSHTVDISKIAVTVTTDSTGKQTVDMTVPDDALPTYTPSLEGAYFTGDIICDMEEHTHSTSWTNSCYDWRGNLTCGKEAHTHSDACKYDSSMFYYEALPVRLIYQVGLTEESEAAVLDLNRTGGSLTFYTNEMQTQDTPYAQTTLFPSDANPFYFDVNPDDEAGRGYHAHMDIKNEQRGGNMTGTAEYSTNCSDDENAPDKTYRVIHALGNNGKLYFEAETIEIPVEKDWGDVPEAQQKPVTVTLYRVTENTSAGDDVTYTGEAVENITLSSDNEWKHTFTGLPLPNDTFSYAIVETDSAGFQPQYTGGDPIYIMLDSGKVQAVIVNSDFFNAETKEPIRVITIKNLPAVELPKTGGSGTILYTAGGLLLMAAAIFLLFYNRKSQISRP